MYYVFVFVVFFFFKQKTAYEMRISDWSSDVCSSDLNPAIHACTGVPMSLANFRRPRASILGFALAAAIGGSFTPGLVFADTGSAAAQVTIPYQELTLPNGLTVTVHEVPKASIVAVNIPYGGGRKNGTGGTTRCPTQFRTRLS